jgi:hypothetical protein
MSLNNISCRIVEDDGTVKVFNSSIKINLSDEVLRE